MHKHTATDGQKKTRKRYECGTNPGHQAKNGTNERPGRMWFFLEMLLKIGTVPENLGREVTLLKPSTTKTISGVFHLSSAVASCELWVIMDGQQLKHKRFLMDLGVTLEWTLSYKEQLTKTAAKLKNRNCLLFKLASMTWLYAPYIILTQLLLSCRVLYCHQGKTILYQVGQQ